MSSSSSPLVSVIMPVGNDRRYLHDAVDSVLAQTLADFELVLIDDGTDSSQPAWADTRVRWVRNPGNGIVDALNHGAAVASGPLLARMDADDIALAPRLQRQLELLDREPDVGIAGAQVEIFADNHKVGAGFTRYQRWINGLVRPEEIRRELFIESPIPHPTAVIRKDLFHRLGGYRHVPWAEDYDLWLRAAEGGIAMAKPEGVLLRWRDHHARLSRVGKRYSLKMFMQARASFLMRRLLRNRTAVIWGAAPTGAAMFDALHPHGARVDAFIDIDPRKIGGRKRDRPVLSPESVDDFREALIIGAVAAPGGRTGIRSYLRSRGRLEGRDFVFVA